MRSTNSPLVTEKPMYGPKNGAIRSDDESQDLVECVRGYARRSPEKFALCCLAVGFVLGWRLKPW
jgi:hypothetical protein